MALWQLIHLAPDSPWAGRGDGITAITNRARTAPMSAGLKIRTVFIIYLLK
jgi:hypothetical protein